ncbi:potassium-transporting ATPase subunit KdpC [Sphingomonas japonica]|uniref:Potassium-transporting ATPase KdpC subunit n=1 Tax=Sphingomonas japonica TaxID=511662 RepID=A0ABX0TW57_9SPHN|nr:potassium-transporting ATPase subunit KdpC [Sphingomonas japonica]NIJ22554.1 K+-transporting ATPase ATPase C chain [Sphingomonas japonica]
MLDHLTSALRPAITLTILFAALLGLAYPAAITGIGQAVFPHQANGSLIRDDDRVVGSELIAQGFTGAQYFQPRGSAAGDGYDALASAGSNLGPTSAVLKERVATDIAAQRRAGVTGSMPADMATVSGSGLDPHISPENAALQLPCVAQARGLSQAQVRTLLDAATEQRLLGFIGEPRVNVLLLNRRLDRAPTNRQPDANGATSRE